MAVVLKQFEAEYGFKSPGFTVDNAGNVVVRTITNTYTPPAPAVVPDFNVEETAGAFSWKKDGTAVAGTNPTITVERGKTYSINLNLSSLAFNIFKADTNNSAVPGELYSTGLSHTNIVTGATLVSGSKNFSQTWQQQTSGANRTVEYFTPDTTGTSYANKKLPVVIAFKELYPRAVFLSPDVTEFNAVNPTAIFLVASVVFDEGELPNQAELFSTKIGKLLKCVAVAVPVTAIFPPTLRLSPTDTSDVL